LDQFFSLIPFYFPWFSWFREVEVGAVKAWVFLPRHPIILRTLSTLRWIRNIRMIQDYSIWIRSPWKTVLVKQTVGD